MRSVDQTDGRSYPETGRVMLHYRIRWQLRFTRDFITRIRWMVYDRRTWIVDLTNIDNFRTRVFFGMRYKFSVFCKRECDFVIFRCSFTLIIDLFVFFLLRVRSRKINRSFSLLDTCTSNNARPISDRYRTDWRHHRSGFGQR